MQRRAITAIASGFVAVTIGAVAVSTAGAETSRPRERAVATKSDKPDAMRPAAARDEIEITGRSLRRELAAAQEKWEYDQQFRAFAAWVERANLERWYAEAMVYEAEQAAAQARRARARSGSSGGGHSGPDGVLACIRHRESRGNYGVVNGSSGAAGAYQFMPGTWNSTARSAGRSDLVGVHPSQASPGDQDAMAQHLLSTQGLGPWGGACG